MANCLPGCARCTPSATCCALSRIDGVVVAVAADDGRPNPADGHLAAIRAWEPQRGLFPAFAVRCVRNQALPAVKTATRHKHLFLTHAVSLNYEYGGDATGPREPGALSLLDALPATRQQDRLELPRFRRHLDASGRKPGKVRFWCRERGRRIRRSSAARRSALRGSETSRSASWPRDLGISNVTLRHWLKDEKAARGERPGALSQDEREELQRLRDENATLRLERRSCEKCRGRMERGHLCGVRIPGAGRCLD
jgi:transposase-like protein